VNSEADEISPLFGLMTLLSLGCSKDMAVSTDGSVLLAGSEVRFSVILDTAGNIGSGNIPGDLTIGDLSAGAMVRSGIGNGVLEKLETSIGFVGGFSSDL
jgi:hypothetical protein